MLIKENLLYKSDKEKIRNFDTNLQKTSSAFFVNFLGFLSAYNKYPTDAKLLNYLKSDKSVRNITDKNNDLSLSAKLLFDHGVLSQQIFEEITKFLYLLKSGKITSIQEDKIRILVRKIYPLVKLKKNLEAIVKEFIKGASLDDIAYDIKELSTMHGFIHVSKEYRLVTKHLDFPAPDDNSSVTSSPVADTVVSAPPATLVNDLDQRIEKFKTGSEIVKFTKEEIKEIFAANGKAQPLKSFNSLNKIGGLDSELENEVIINYFSTTGVRFKDLDDSYVSRRISLSSLDKAIQNNPSFMSDIDDVISFISLAYSDIELYSHLYSSIQNILLHTTNDKDISKLTSFLSSGHYRKFLQVLKAIVTDKKVIKNGKLFYTLVTDFQGTYSLPRWWEYKFENPLSEYSVKLAERKILDILSYYGNAKDRIKNIISLNHDKELLEKIKGMVNSAWGKVIIDYAINSGNKTYNEIEFYREVLRLMTDKDMNEYKNEWDDKDFLKYLTPLLFTDSLSVDEAEKFIKYLEKNGKVKPGIDDYYLDNLGDFYKNPPSEKYEKYHNLFSGFSILTFTENTSKKLLNDENIIGSVGNTKVFYKIVDLYNYFKSDYLYSFLNKSIDIHGAWVSLRLITELKEGDDKNTKQLLLKLSKEAASIPDKEYQVDIVHKLFKSGEFDVPDHFTKELKNDLIFKTTNDDKFLNDPRFLDAVKDASVERVFILSEATHIEKGLSDFILKKVIDEKLEYTPIVKSLVGMSNISNSPLPKYKFYDNLVRLSFISDDKDLYESLFKLYGAQYTNALKQNILTDSLKKELYGSPISPDIELSVSEINSILKINGISLKSNVRRKRNQPIMEWAEELRNNPTTLPPLKIVKDENTPEDLEKLTAIINKKYNKRKHGDIAPKVIETFTTTFSDAEYKQFLKDNEGTEQLIPAFHGTGSVAASFILRNGFTIVKENASGIKITGKSLGNGIYFTNVLDKVTQYVGEGYTRRIGTTGYIFEMKAALGELNKDYRAGGLPGTEYPGWLSPEWAVFKPNKQLHIVRVMKVEMVSFNNIDDYIEKHKDSIVDESKNMKTFNEFLNEKKNAYTGNSTRFIFRDENIPLSKDGKFIHYSKVNWKKLLGNRGWMEKTQDGVCVVFKSDDYKVYDIPYIIKFFREGKIREDFYKLNKWL